jgi:hypothetical protein
MFINVEWLEGLFLEYKDHKTHKIELNAKTANAVIRNVLLTVVWIAVEFILPFKNNIKPINPITSPIGMNLSEK